MPYSEGPTTKTTKVFDTFIHVLDGDLIEIIWPSLTLSDVERKTLALLLNRLGYFGRAESLVEAKLVAQPAHAPNARPLTNGELPQGDEELVRVICQMLPTDYLTWRSGYEAAISVSTPKPTKKAKEKVSSVGAPLPVDHFEALLADTGDLKRAGWNQPPGAIWIDYARRRDAFEVRAQSNAKLPSGPVPTIARFAVASQVLPRLTQTISVAERIHQSLVKISGSAPVFTGLDSDGKPRHGHDHVRILCESTDERGHITRITLFAPMGFDVRARYALDQLRRVWGIGGHDLQLILLGFGQRTDFAGLDASRDQSPLLVEATEWRSLTPFVPTRHAKAHRNGRPKCDQYGLQIGSPAHDLCRLIDESGLPRPTAIEPMSTGSLGNKSIRWLAFQRERKHGNGTCAGQMGYGFRITFPQAVRGPLTFGYASHFGLGLFAPVESVSSHFTTP